MVDLKRKVEVNNNVHDRLENNSIILDKILDSQKSPFDKTGIGYKKEEEQSGIRTGSSRSLKKIIHSEEWKKIIHPQNLKEKFLSKDLQRTQKTSNQEDLKELIKELAPLLKADLERKQSQDGTKFPGMEMVLMAIVILVIILDTKPWTAEAMWEGMLEIPTTLPDVGHEIVLVILLHIVEL